MLGIARNTVRAALASDGPPKYRRGRQGRSWTRSSRGSVELLAAYPRMPATVIAERIGWPHGITVLSGRVAELRPVYLPPDPASAHQLCGRVRSRSAICGFPPITMPAGFGQMRTATLLPVLTMVTRLFAVALGGADPDAAGRGSVRWLVAADRRSGRGRRGRWSGTVRARSGGGAGGAPSSPPSVRRSAARWAPR